MKMNQTNKNTVFLQLEKAQKIPHQELDEPLVRYKKTRPLNWVQEILGANPSPLPLKNTQSNKRPVVPALIFTTIGNKLKISV